MQIKSEMKYMVILKMEGMGVDNQNGLSKRIQ
jgi:hypothetical protein